MPEKIQPGRGLRSRVQQAGGRKQSGKTQGMEDGHCGIEQIAASDDEQPARAQDVVLSQQEDEGNDVPDDDRGLIDGQERRNRRQRHLGKRRGAKKGQQRSQHDGEGQAFFVPAGAHRRYER